MNAKKYNKENVIFKYLISDNTPSNLFGDKTKIKEIINNILDNSFKYTNNGSITLTINSVLNNDICNLIIEIKDTGIGIKSEDLNKIFNGNEIDNDINSSVNRDGLGLLISKDLVNLLNGTISVNSYYGSGSVFTINIPQKLKNELEIVEQTNTTKFNNKKVLLVDDDRLNNRILKRLLKIYGIELDTCERGIECIDKINNTKRLNNSFHVSKIENELKNYLEENNINFIYQYKSKLYPFNCDFYFPENDLYVEIQGSWTHGKHPFNEKNKDDIKILNEWIEKCNKSEYYKNAIEVWTKRDVKQRKIARKNNSNYLDIYSIKLSEVINILNKQMKI